MFESIKRQLNEIGCTMYELTEVSRTAWEFYFIRHRLDQNRVVTTRTLEAKLYRLSEDGKTLGSASGSIHPTACEAETKKGNENKNQIAGIKKSQWFQ